MPEQQVEQPPPPAQSGRWATFKRFVKPTWGVIKPLLLIVITAQVTLELNQRAEERHALGISVVKSGSAIEREPPPSDPFTEAFLAPDPTPTPDPNPRYGYTMIIRNDGDFPEEHVTISIGFHAEADFGTPLSGPDIDASSSLLARTITQAAPAEPVPGYGLSVARLYPDEWVSLHVTWADPTDVSVQARSDAVSASAFE